MLNLSNGSEMICVESSDTVVIATLVAFGIADTTVVVGFSLYRKRYLFSLHRLITTEQMTSETGKI
jgi:hypothetical protein